MERFPATLGMCLILAACVTAWVRYPVGLPISTRELSHSLLLAAIAAELGLGILLLIPRWSHAAWSIAVLLFLLLGLMFLFRGGMEYLAAGAGPNLGSQLVYGSIFFVAAGVLAIRLRLLDRSESVIEQYKPRAANLAMILIWLALFTACAAVVTGRSDEFAAVETAALGNDRLVILHPQNWIGGTLPITEYVSPKRDLAHGNWTIFLYQHDCPKSQELLSRYEALPTKSTSGELSEVLLIELPPYDVDSSTPTGARYAKLSDHREWIAQTPIEIQIRNGIVAVASLGMPSVSNTPSKK